MRQIFREIRQDWLQFLSVFLMSFLCLTVYSALIGISAGMEQEATAFFKERQLADTILTAKDITATDIEQVGQLDGISQVESRLALTGRLLLQEHKTLNLSVTATNEVTLNQPLVTKGASYGTQDGIWLNKELFDHYGLSLGDKVTLDLNDLEVIVPIAGIIQQPEHLFLPESNDYPYPNYKKTAYGFISKSDLSERLAQVLPDNQLIIKQKTTNFIWFQQEYQRLFGDRYQQAVLTKQMPTISAFLDKQQQIEKLALLFPFLFIVLSSLTMGSTMTRFIKKYQVTLGTYKAMGLKNSEIYQHYLSFGLVISGLGSLIGIACGPSLIAPLLIQFLRNQYGIPAWSIVFDSSIWLVALLLIICCVLTTYFPCRNILKETPARTLRLQVSDRFKPGMIEKSGLLNKLSFTNHWIARGILRNKGRTLMGIFGALGSTVLLVAGLGINRSIAYTVDTTFNEINQYEERITFKHPLDQQALEPVENLLTDQSFHSLDQQTIDLIDNQTTREGTITIIDGRPLLKLMTPKKQRLSLENLSDNQVLLTNQLARELHVQKGDTLYLKLKADRQFSPVYIKDIVSISSPQGMITTRENWENIGYDYQPTALLIKKALTADLRSQIEEKAVVNASQLKAAEYQDMLKLIQATVLIVSLIVVAAIFLGVVILANFNLLIFTERFREFATLKVLGFKQAEIWHLAFQENLFLTVIGLALGFIGGHFFLNAYVSIISPDNQEYMVQFRWPQYLIVSGIVLSCSLLINVFLDHKIRRIPMAESLKVMTSINKKQKNKRLGQ